ncbi:MAG: cytochrome c, partial [Alphaproteobacteria bacterium]|nr:cytochrome c [Alphaproteobacteria bacterium]
MRLRLHAGIISFCAGFLLVFLVPEPATAGARLYEEHCASCHGENLVNTGQTADLRELKAEEKPRFDQSVRLGKGQMPPWEGVLSDAEIDLIWEYIRANS